MVVVVVAVAVAPSRNPYYYYSKTTITQCGIRLFAEDRPHGGDHEVKIKI